MVNFDLSVKTILKHEGELINDPMDPGGLTKYGISQSNYPNLNIRDLTVFQAKNIYKKDYWFANRLNELHNQHIATMALDMVAHHGQGAKLLQRAVNDSGIKIKTDNIIGPKTLSAINKIAPALFVKNAIKRRIEYMRKITRQNPKTSKFLPGWIKRAKSFSIPISLSKITIIGITLYFLWKKMFKS